METKKLSPNHFTKEPKPKKEYFHWDLIDNPIDPEKGDKYNEVDFNKDLQEWERKYKPVEYDWISFEDRKPEVGPIIYFLNETGEIFEGIWDRRVLKGYFFGEWTDYDYQSSPTKWVLKELHDNKVKNFNDNQVLFEGWKSKNGIEFTKGDLVVVFNTRAMFLTDYSKIFFSVTLINCSVQLFKDICKENDIKL